MTVADQDSIRRRVAGGGLAYGFTVKGLRTVEAAIIGKNAGYDWLFIDLEHSAVTLESACQISMAAQLAGIVPLVRVTVGSFSDCTRLLDGGAGGIIMPHVDTVELARELADTVKYPPLGSRSVMGNPPQLGFMTVPWEEAMARLNTMLWTVVMLETPEAIANAEAIAAVDGIDVLLVGTNDLCVSSGVPGRPLDPTIIAAYERVVAAAAKHGKIAGAAGIGDHEVLTRYRRLGVQLVQGPSDTALIVQAAIGRVAKMRELG